MKGLIVTGGSSKSGKTIFTLGLLRLFQRKGLDFSSFKLGPDYIDLAYHQRITGGRSGNLDYYMQGSLEALGRNPADFVIMEGAMGYFDGIGNGKVNSAFDLAQKTGAPSLLVYMPVGEMFTVVTKIKGMIDYARGTIGAIVLNCVSKNTYFMLKEAIERETGVPVIGYIPYDTDLTIESRHLGLMMPDEIENLDEIIEKTADYINENVGMDKFLTLFGKLWPVEIKRQDKLGLTIGVAKDQAFTFHYKENLEILEEMGELIYFSPLEDERLPDVDLVIIGGGYPELYLEKLGANKSMRQSIKDYWKAGGRIFSYGGGYTYLVEDFDGYEMVGIFKGHGHMTDSLQGFGYCLVKGQGVELPAREYRRSKVEGGGEDFYFVKVGDGSMTRGGEVSKKAMGFHPHINLLAWRDFIRDFAQA